MTLGEKYIKDSYVKELTYNQAIEQSKKELLSMGISNRSHIYDNDSIYDSPIYPCNAELYDEFCDDCGFDTTEFFLFIAKRLEID
jgi:hypothetical protein